MRHILLGLSLLATPAIADTLSVPASLPRAGQASVDYRFDQPPPASGTVTLEWTDASGRIVARQQAPIAAGQTQVAFHLDLSRAVVLQNHLHATAQLGDQSHDAAADFIATPQDEPWRRFQVLYWQSDDAAQIAALRAAGATGGKVTAMREGIRPDALARAVAPFLAADQRFYIENIATDFYAAYHRWLPDRAVNAAFVAAQDAYRRNPNDQAVFQRQPSLSDPAWQARINQRLAAHVQAFGPWRPFFYSLGDETGIADLAAQWDFDFSPASLAAFRTWLHGQYTDLAALNAQWGSNFATWDAVTPMTTSKALQRPEGNLSAWGDFKDFMDAEFARALRAGTDAVHKADPTALAGMEGAQIPGWGGYDYTRLAHAVDVMEIYEFANNVDIVHALNPNLVLLTTSFRDGPPEAWRLWHTALLGVRGSVVWDSKGDFITGQGGVGPRAHDLAPVLTELRGGLGALLAMAHPVPGPVGLLYSPASLRISWLRDRIDDANWAMRSAEDENADNAPRRATRDAVQALDRLGMPAHWLTPADVSNGVPQGLRAVILPQALSLPDQAVAALRRFTAAGGLVLADTAPGGWDQHLRRRAAPLTDGVTLLPDLSLPQLAPVLARAGISGVSLRLADGQPVTDVAIREYQVGAARLIALHRDQPALSLTLSAPMVLTLDQPAWVRDLRGSAPATQQAKVPVTLDPVAPTILALTHTPLPPPALHAPARLHTGQTADLVLNSAAPVLDVEVLDPSDTVMARYGGLVWPHDGRAELRIPFAVNDRVGTWTLRVTDPLSGGRSETRLSLD